MRGFTFLEMMAVIAIAAIMTTMAGFSFNAITTKSTLQNEQTKVLQALLDARNIASRSQKCVTVNVNTNTPIILVTPYVIQPDNGVRPIDCTPPDPTSGRTALNDATIETDLSPGFSLSQFQSASGNTDNLIFQTDGGLLDRNVNSLIISDKNGNQSTMQIFPAIGQVRVQ